jgi:hypothetical protein
MIGMSLAHDASLHLSSHYADLHSNGSVHNYQRPRRQPRPVTEQVIWIILVFQILQFLDICPKDIVCFDIRSYLKSAFILSTER